MVKVTGLIFYNLNKIGLLFCEIKSRRGIAPVNRKVEMRKKEKKETNPFLNNAFRLTKQQEIESETRHRKQVLSFKKQKIVKREKVKEKTKREYTEP